MIDELFNICVSKSFLSFSLVNSFQYNIFIQKSVTKVQFLYHIIHPPCFTSFYLHDSILLLLFVPQNFRIWMPFVLSRPELRCRIVLY